MCVTTKYIGKKKNLERIVGSCSKLGFIERDWSLFLVNVHPGVSVHYKHSLATSSLFKTWTVHFSSRYVCKWHVLWLLSERSTGQGFTELCNRGPSVYTSPVNRSTVGFIDNLCASDTVSDPTACFSAIHMQSPFIDEISKSIKEERPA